MMEISQICRACLVTNVKMYDLQTSSLSLVYLEITGISDIGIYTRICFECVARLQKCKDFRSNCIKAHESLAYRVTKKDLQLTYNKEKIFGSPLKYSVLTITECRDNDTDAFIQNIENEQYVTKSSIKHKSEEADVDSEVSINSTEPNVDNTYPFDDETKTELEGDYENINVQTVANCNDNLLKKVKTKRCAKNKVRQNKSLFDPKSFEEFATVSKMTSEDAKREVKLRKDSSNYKNSKLKCNLCYRGFENENTFNNHMKTHSMTNGKYECEFCYRRFPKRCLYNSHVSTCHKLKITCRKCPYVCFNVAQATCHMKLHKGIKYTCEVCQKSFSMPNTLASHKRIKHASEFVCAICGSVFAVGKGLKAHNTLIHKEDTNEKKGPMCTDCDIHFATETAWKRHLVLSSKHEVSGCQTCGEIFSDRKQFKSHTRCKRSPVKNACAICALVLNNRSEYKSHMTSQHPQSAVARRILEADELPYVCEYCGKRFRHPSVMWSHQKKHTGERPYSCNVCGKSFSYQAALCAHRETHRDVRLERDKFTCDICDKLFTTKSALIKHIKNHLNIRPHSCDICGKSYQHQCDVKYHKQHVHGNVPWPTRDRTKRAKLTEQKSDLME